MVIKEGQVLTLGKTSLKVYHLPGHTYPYPGGGTVFEPALKLAQRKPGEPHPFVDNATWRKWLDVAEAGTVKYIEDAKAGCGDGRGGRGGQVGT